MRLLAVYTQKGGAGKSTLALNLAGYLHSIGQKVVIIDLDPGKTCYEVSLGKNLPFKVLRQRPDEAPDADVVIFDWPGGETMPPVGTVIVPTQPTVLSWRYATRTIYALEQASIRVVPVINMYDERRKLHVEFAQTYPYIKVKNRSIYERSLFEGYTVFAEQVSNFSGAREARKEIKSLWEVIVNE